MSKKLIIVGAGEFAMIAYEYFTHDSDFEVCAFSIEKEYLENTTLYDLPIVELESIETKFPPADYKVFIAIPASQLNRLRTRLYGLIKSKGYTCASYISSRAFVWHNAQIGENCFIFENNTVQPFVSIGNNVILWSGNHIGHRSRINDNCFLSSHVVVSGYCDIGESCFLGVNSTLNDRISIPKDCVIASGTLVNKNLPEPERIYYGSPAQMLPKKSSLKVKL
ncbi:sugar O-acyltransferase (sialic acid O-acetyltransferase NeuD family) [Pseudomonas sp. SJZ103]|uniref:acetyltransferase n=1 Tax=unclassified Pseudomonas TaxID=196821 RepID=UPI0011A619CD|nr:MULTISPECIES: acetyltransferase [unclassified Pseudomonas]MBB6287759.1 sugar O-acyltransferase (sialic acid O-acetyltransferase NeuD family) [Pseudomonas sp. SJZ073]MBB6312731.1 sugar O-acyltransferase (sialic acid O-acetyltransferase NeuD family) [Pseudomonas sp. JAI120]MCS4310754.1 sugar O-acyltransferase (sialic acid O-acetyltransferase NeuD family) [Pseudomonas sp. BIGb0381]TWC75335.1 sugar O-acyltransferase (sialic acid O-acetyltransferase NeuD family) [Pseudomonas sp. SJZ103]TWC92537.